MNERLEGHGPWKFEIPALSAGETEYLDFRNMSHNGQKGFFRNYLPFDKLQVTNQSGQTLLLEINNQNPDIVVPNAVETYTETGVTYLSVTNDGNSAISAGDVTITTERSPYNADDAAREQRKRGPVRRVVNHFTGL